MKKSLREAIDLFIEKVNQFIFEYCLHNYCLHEFTIIDSQDKDRDDVIWFDFYWQGKWVYTDKRFNWGIETKKDEFCYYTVCDYLLAVGLIDYKEYDRITYLIKTNSITKSNFIGN